MVVEDEEDYLEPMSREEEEALRYIPPIMAPQLGRGEISLVLFLVVILVLFFLILFLVIDAD